jgi:hypothetical protein
MAGIFVTALAVGTAFSEGLLAGDATAAGANRLKQVAAPVRPDGAPAAVRARTEAASAAAAHRLAVQRAALEAAVAAKAEADRAAYLRSLAARAARFAPPARPAPAGTERWRELLSRYPWDVAVASRIVWCESKGDPNARNGRHVGLFQIAHGPTDPTANVALAFRMYTARGWRPWYASRACWA